MAYDGLRLAADRAMKAKPYKYQREGIKLIDFFDGRVLLADDVGLGKSLQALWWITQADAWPAVVVCPANVKWHWEHEALQNLGIRAAVLEGQKPPDVESLARRPKLTILNYDILQYWVPWLREIGAKTIILDECAALMNRETKRTKASRALCRDVPHVLSLSATPLMNRPREMWPTLNILRPDEFGAFWSFGHKYCGAKLGYQNRWVFDGASNVKSLNKLLRKTCMIRRRAKDVALELPDKIREILPLPLSDEQEYSEATNDFLMWLRKKDAAAARRASKAQAVVQMGHLMRLAAKLKLRGVVDWINNLLATTDEKVVIFAVHTKCVRALRRRINAQSVVVDGSVSGRARKSAVMQFQNDPRVRVFIGNIQAAGVGLNGLQGSARIVVFAELPFVPATVTQAEGRLHRIGQKDTVWAYYFVAKGTIEEKLLAILQQKQGVVGTILDGDAVPDDLPVHDLLLRELEKETLTA